MTAVQDPQVEETTVGQVADAASGAVVAEVSTDPPASSSSKLERRALALMIGTAANALLGIAFWAAAARMYTPAEVGRGSAIISAATLLATLSQLNLGNVYARFLGAAGGKQRSLVFSGYGVIGGIALLLGAAYAALGPGDLLFAGALEVWVFPGCVVILAVFALQDMILVSVHRPGFVTIENITWSFAKLGVLMVLAAAWPQNGIQLAWMLPAIAAVIGVTVYLFFRRWTPTTEGFVPFPARRELTKAVAGEYLIGLVSTAVPLLLPLLVVHTLGLAANAYFSVPWLVATSLSLLMWNIASILLVEAAGDPGRLPHLVARALRLSLAVAVAGGLCIWFLGPVVLSLLGPGYAENSTWLLRVTALAAPAIAVVIVWTTAARSRGRLHQVVAVQAAIGISMLTISSLLLTPLGVVGIGLAYLGVQTAAALFLIRPLTLIIRSDSFPTGRGRHRRSGRTAFSYPARATAA